MQLRVCVCTYMRLLFKILSVITSVKSTFGGYYPRVNFANLINLFFVQLIYLEKPYVIGFAFESSANDILYCCVGELFLPELVEMAGENGL